MNRKADEKLMTIYWIVIMVLAGVTIAACVAIVNGSAIDIRQAEAEVLAGRVINCIIDSGYLRADFSNDFDLLEKCNLIFKERENEITSERNYYVNIEIMKLDRTNLYNITLGEETMKNYCDIQKQQNKDEKKWPQCQEKEVYSLLKQNKIDSEIKIKVVAGINKGVKNV